MSPPLRVLIAASGTGGHLFPALYLAKALKRKDPEASIEFVGSGRALEERVIDRNGFRRHVITAVGVKNTGLSGVIRFLQLLPRTVIDSWLLLTEFKPQLVVGVGGYVSVLPILMARLRGIPTWIHEAELKPGLANWLLSLFATRCSVAFDDAEMPWWARVVRTGHPVREELQNWVKGEPERLPPKRLLIVGGSQGARSLDEAAATIASVAKQQGLEVLHQTRPENQSEVQAAYLAAGVSAKVVPFLDPISEAYQWCDLILCRSGAGTVMELGIVGKPVILVPYPFAQGNHQRANALTLVQCGKGMLVEEGEGFRERLAAVLMKGSDAQQYRSLWDAASPNRSSQAAEVIATELLGLRKKGDLN
jgi:UDP-N-acetylglucosamine--N-acetylmuramyl-(pentapeptide) pyrophosphoryl-undecaprenol N-acetylglucosamine transferase